MEEPTIEIARLRSERNEARRAERDARVMLHLIVKAAGGAITVPQKLYVETIADERLEATNDPATGDMTFRII